MISEQQMQHLADVYEAGVMHKKASTFAELLAKTKETIANNPMISSTAAGALVGAGSGALDAYLGDQDITGKALTGAGLGGAIGAGLGGIYKLHQKAQQAARDEEAQLRSLPAGETGLIGKGISGISNTLGLTGSLGSLLANNALFRYLYNQNIQRSDKKFTEGMKELRDIRKEYNDLKKAGPAKTYTWVPDPNNPDVTAKLKAEDWTKMRDAAVQSQDRAAKVLQAEAKLPNNQAMITKARAQLDEERARLARIEAAQSGIGGRDKVIHKMDLRTLHEQADNKARLINRSFYHAGKPNGYLRRAGNGTPMTKGTAGIWNAILDKRLGRGRVNWYNAFGLGLGELAGYIPGIYGTITNGADAVENAGHWTAGFVR